MSIYADVIQPHEFFDRFQGFEKGEGVDVIVPLLHATPFWRQNLYSYFREIPIRRLLVGDAGAIDSSPEVASDFPRTEIHDHTHLKTLGKSIATLISEVKTEHFIYLQSDTFLPHGWFDAMWEGTKTLDWFGCPHRPLIVMSGPTKDYSGERPLAGTQIGRTSVFEGLNELIEDDFGYRQEDFILEEHVLRRGGTVGALRDTFHVHQITERVTSGRKMSVKNISVEYNPDDDDLRVLATQLFGLVKYCDPKRPTVLRAATEAMTELMVRDVSATTRAIRFARETSKEWEAQFPKMLARGILALGHRKSKRFWLALKRNVKKHLKRVLS